MLHNTTMVNKFGDLEKYFKDIPGYKGLYLINASGDIISLPRLAKVRGGGYRMTSTRVLKKHVNFQGYIKAYLSNGTVGKFYSVHRLVAEVFLPKVSGKKQINHKDGNKLNNKVSNLEWCTDRENQLHAYKNGLKRRISRNGESNFNAKLTEEKVIEIRSLKENYSEGELSKMFGMSRGAIYAILNRITWRDVK